jgi:two-component system NtrC family sensor kinase
MEMFAPDDDVSRLGTALSQAGEAQALMAQDNAKLQKQLVLVQAMLTERSEELLIEQQRLYAAQTQLIDAEKMSTLGQLVASVAHEINTPISAIKSSGGTMTEALRMALSALPKLFQTLDGVSQHLLMQLIDNANVPRQMLTSREERAVTRELLRELEHAGVSDARRKAGVLVQLRAEDNFARYLPILHHAQSDAILDTAAHVGLIINHSNNINMAVDRVSKFVLALKSFSRVDRNGEMVSANLRDSIETVLTIYQSQIRYGIELDCSFGDVPPLLCIPDALVQVWTNLVHNALQAMNYQGTLTVVLRRSGDDVVVSVGDTGCGIPEAVRAKIFDPFFTTKPIGEGSGLGLGIVTKILDKHKGRIEVQSEVGVGTIFSVYLPYVAADPLR